MYIIFSFAAAPNPARTLYSLEHLRMDSYTDKRVQIQKALSESSNEDAFKERISSYVKDLSVTDLHVKDVKSILHVATDSQEDITLIISLLRMFYGRNENLGNGNNYLGPIALRFFYHYQLDELALKVKFDNYLCTWPWCLLKEHSIRQSDRKSTLMNISLSPFTLNILLHFALYFQDDAYLT